MRYAGHEERVYHGITERHRDNRHEWSQLRILVEESASGPTERKNVAVLHELSVAYSDDGSSDFNWGYGGGGPYRTAAAVLADALDLESAETAGMAWWAAGEIDPTMGALCQAFRTDFVSHFGSDWRISRPAVLRWALGWANQCGVELQITGLPGPDGVWRLAKDDARP